MTRPNTILEKAVLLFQGFFMLQKDGLMSLQNANLKLSLSQQAGGIR